MALQIIHQEKPKFHPEFLKDKKQAIHLKYVEKINHSTNIFARAKFILMKRIELLMLTPLYNLYFQNKKK